MILRLLPGVALVVGFADVAAAEDAAVASQTVKRLSDELADTRRQLSATRGALTGTNRTVCALQLDNDLMATMLGSDLADAARAMHTRP